MKCWIKKENDLDPIDSWGNSYVFTINRDSASTVFSNLPDAWYHLDQMSINPVYEDLFIIGLSIFAIDKRISRKHFNDCWTRELEVSIPVLEYETYINSQQYWNQLLTFLTGDKWSVTFRRTESVYSFHKNKNRKHIDIDGCDCVCLFSGGLDSFCGAIKLLEDGKSPCLVGHNEYPKLRYVQEDFCNHFQKSFPDQKSTFIGFTAGAKAPINYENGDVLSTTENTSRGRSLLFLCAAITIASIIGNSVPVYIPENGFIGINVPLTNSRKGSCSTRTTHPYFINLFKDILSTIGIDNSVENIFAYLTKREIVSMVANSEVFKKDFDKTISCSHPCNPRYSRTGSRLYPTNCGYCYPCMIRKSALLDVADNTKYTHEFLPSQFINKYSDSDKVLDLQALIGSVYRFANVDEKSIHRMIRLTGPISSEDQERYERVYKAGIHDLIELLLKDPNMKEYLDE